MSSRISVLLILLSVVCCLTPFRTSTAATISATSCTEAAVSSALGTAANGDTVNVPAGTCSWSSLSVNKRVTLAGAGVDVTKISCGGGECAQSTMGGVRITGFTFSNCDECITVRGTAWRVDHSKFNNTSHAVGIRARGEVDNVQPSGLVDHNTFLFTNVHSFGSAAMRSEGDHQDVLWTQDPGFGTSRGLYVEDNVFANGINSVDCNYSGNYVFRYNTVSNSYLEAHSVQGDNRACQRWEIYNNVFTNTTWAVVFLRGGSGYMFGNTNNNDDPIALNNVRDTENVPSAGRCNGSSNWDQNASEAGYSCRDQIGRSKDAAKWAPGMPYNQPLTPAYIWNNTTSDGGGRQMSISLHNPSNPKHIIADRDFYAYTSSFNGTSGVGSGPLSQRPSTCTPGVGYWATDQGNWNKKSGPSGVLYTCAGQNAWSASYVPLTYPHPLASGDTAAPMPPGNLQIQ